jgi:hypothetical protein
MTSQDAPISWMALEEGTPVYAGERQVGKVSTVVADLSKDIFSGVAFRAHLIGPQRFAHADLIDRMTAKAVLLRCSAEEAEKLELYEA